MTWEQLKIFTLQKMFEIQGDELVEDELTRPYLLSMPQVANEALQLLCTAGRYIRRVFIIEQTPDGQPLDCPAPGYCTSDCVSFNRFSVGRILICLITS